MNTQIIHQSTWSPLLWQGSFGVQFNAEAYYRIEWIPGSPSLPEDYASLGVQDYYDNGWYDACGNVNLQRFNSNGPFWEVGAPACDHTQTWTNG